MIPIDFEREIVVFSSYQYRIAVRISYLLEIVNYYYYYLDAT